jgi:hypothetical protein
MSLSVKVLLFTFLAVFGGFLIRNHAVYFGPPIDEVGDLAANALQIGRAKRFQELHGNYSRYQWHHPGPAFFYVYAAGELVLYDFLGAVKSPHQAHLIFSVALQALFFSAAIAILASWMGMGATLLACVLLAGLYFLKLPRAFQSLWPPDVLVLPFFALLVSGASVFRGAASHVLCLLVATGFLVHGHAAQVGLAPAVFLISLGGLWWNTRRAGLPHSRLGRKDAVACAVAAFLFALPLAVDLSHGKEGNFYKLVTFASVKPHDKFLYQAVFYNLYFLTFDGTVSDRLGADLPSFFAHAKARAPWLLSWAGLIAFAFWLVGLSKHLKGSSKEERFVRALFGYVALGALVALYWAYRQTGPLMEYNSYFVYSLPLLFFLTLALSLFVWLRPKRMPSVGPVYLLAVLPLFALGTRADLHTQHVQWTEESRVAVDKAMGNLAPGQIPYLAYQAEDWPCAVSVLLKAVRAGKQPMVPDYHPYIMGAERTVPASVDPISRGYKVWKIRCGRISAPPQKIDIFLE